MTSKATELPALQLVISGGIESSNLPSFQSSALELINSINIHLVTDDDFSTAEKASKWLRDGERRIDECKAHAIENTASIDEAFRLMDELKESMRQKRLDLDRQIKAEKDSRRKEIQQGAQIAFSNWKHEATLDMPMPVSDDIDVAGAMKGKKTFSSLQAAADAEVERAKAECQRRIDEITVRMNMLDSLSAGYEWLFISIKPMLLSMTPDKIVETVRQRIDAYNAEQARQQEEERERIRKEEQESARAQYEAQKAEEEKERLRLQREAEEKAKEEQAALDKIAADEEDARQAELSAGDVQNNDCMIPLEMLGEAAKADASEDGCASISMPKIKAALSNTGIDESQRSKAIELNVSYQESIKPIQITKNEYDDLLRSKRILECLQDAGIADWPQLDSAMEEYRKRYEH